MRTSAVCLLLLALVPAAARSAPPDENTFRGMDAYVAGELLAAVRAFEAALADAPDDAIRAKRLAHARKHGIATRAVAAFALATGQRERFHSSLSKAARHISYARNPDAGWRYGARPGDTDTSVTYWMTAALDRSRAAGADVDARCFEGARAWVDAVTDPETYRAGYVARETGVARPTGMLDVYPPEKTESTTAAACLIRGYCGERHSRATRGHLALVRAVPPTAGCPDMYYWFLGARAFVAQDGRVPRKWYDALVAAANGCKASNGSIDPRGPWGAEGGRVYATAITCLALQSPLAGARAGNPVSASDFVRSGSARVAVPIAGTPWSTGLYLDESMKLTVTPGGTVLYHAGLPAAGPGGMKKDPPGSNRITKKGKYGCLLGQLDGNGRPFALQRKRTLKVKGCGELFVFVNAKDPAVATGGFTLEISVGGE